MVIKSYQGYFNKKTHQKNKDKQQFEDMKA